MIDFFKADTILLGGMGVKKKNPKHFTTKLFNQNMTNKNFTCVMKYSSVVTALFSVEMQNILTFYGAPVMLLLVLNKINSSKWYWECYSHT